MPPFSLAENQHRSRLADDEKKKPPTPAPAPPSETPRKRPSKNSKLTSCGELSQIPHVKSIAAPAARLSRSELSAASCASESAARTCSRISPGNVSGVTGILNRPSTRTSFTGAAVTDGAGGAVKASSSSFRNRINSPRSLSRSASAASRICRSAANWHSRSPAFRSASAFAASSAADSARTVRTSASSARMRPSPDPATEAQVGVSGAFKPKNDNTSSPPTAFVFGNGFISPTWALFLNIPLESCEKSVFPMISVFKNRLPHRGLLRREEESRTGQH